MRETPVPDLSEEDYLKLFGGKRSRDPDDLAPAYARARRTERAWPPAEIPASALNELWREVLGEREAREEPLPVLEYDRVSGEVPQDRFGELCHAAVAAELDLGGSGRAALEAARALIPAHLRDLLETEARRLAEGFLESGLGRAGPGFRDGPDRVTLPVRPGRGAPDLRPDGPDLPDGERTHGDRF